VLRGFGIHVRSEIRQSLSCAVSSSPPPELR
jgi:hypothetical protein